MTGFAILIGACRLVPPSPKLALLLIMWMFGTLPGVSYSDYRARYIALGGSDVAAVERCFLHWKAIPYKEGTR